MHLKHVLSASALALTAALIGGVLAASAAKAQEAKEPDTLTIAWLPMRSSYRRAVTETPQARAYQRWLGQRVSLLGGTSIDLAEPAWIDDSLFADSLHLNAHGAQKFSADLGFQLASLRPAGASSAASR